MQANSKRANTKQVMSACSRNFLFRHSHGGTGCGSTHKPFFASLAIPSPYLPAHPIPPAPAFFDQSMIDVSPIGQDYVSKGALVLVVAVGLDGNFIPKGENANGVLGILAVGLAFLRAVAAVEMEAFSVLVVQDVEGVAVEDGDGPWVSHAETTGRQLCA